MRVTLQNVYLLNENQWKHGNAQVIQRGCTIAYAACAKWKSLLRQRAGRARQLTEMKENLHWITRKYKLKRRYPSSIAALGYRNSVRS